MTIVKFVNGDEYHGDIKDGLRHGQGLFKYSATGDTYVGGFERGLFHGFGVLQRGPFLQAGRVHTGYKYEGEWSGGKKHGKGVLHDGAGEVYDGDWREDLREGVGTVVYAHSEPGSGGRSSKRRRAPDKPTQPGASVSSGALVQRPSAGGAREDSLAAAADWRDTPSIIATASGPPGSGPSLPSKSSYTGQWLAGFPHGKGLLKLPGGDQYEGGFARGRFHGEGTLRYAAGGVFSGAWVSGRRCGIGRRVFSGGAIVEGEWADDLLSGRGVYRSALGNELYVGAWKEGRPHGVGTLQKASGDSYQGRWECGIPCGTGRYSYAGGKGWYEGEFAAQLRTGLPAKEELTAEARARRREVRDARYTGQREAVISALAAGGMYRPTVLTGGAGAAAASGGARGAAAAGAGAPNMPKAGHRIIVGSLEDEAFVTHGSLEGTSVAFVRDGRRHGHGVRVWATGARYEGEWVQDVQHGFGVYCSGPAAGCGRAASSSGSSSADCSSSGYGGVIGSSCDERFEGTWECGQRRKGVASYGITEGKRFLCPLGNAHDGAAGRCFYDGEWGGVGSTFHGKGTFTCIDGRQYSGAWKHGKPDGQGRWVTLPVALHADCCHEAELQLAAAEAAEAARQGLEDDPATAATVRERRQRRLARHTHCLDDLARTRVYVGSVQAGRRTGGGRAVLNNGDVLEGLFHDGRPQGIVRYIFLASQRIAYAEHDAHGTRVRWATAAETAALRARDAAAEELRGLRAAIGDVGGGGGGDGGDALGADGQGEFAAPLTQGAAATATLLQAKLRRQRHQQEHAQVVVRRAHGSDKPALLAKQAEAAALSAAAAAAAERLHRPLTVVPGPDRDRLA